MLGEPWRAVPGGGIRFDERNHRQPDLMVVEKSVLRSGMATPPDVLLVAEVMSPSSVTEDRLVKPVQYAAAGVAHVWRLGLAAAPALLTHELEGGVYRETGRFSNEVVLERPAQGSGSPGRLDPQPVATASRFGQGPDREAGQVRLSM